MLTVENKDVAPFSQITCEKKHRNGSTNWASRPEIVHVLQLAVSSRAGGHPGNSFIPPNPGEAGDPLESPKDCYRNFEPQGGYCFNLESFSPKGKSRSVRQMILTPILSLTARQAWGPCALSFTAPNLK